MLPSLVMYICILENRLPSHFLYKHSLVLPLEDSPVAFDENRRLFGIGPVDLGNFAATLLDLLVKVDVRNMRRKTCLPTASLQ